MLILGTRLGDQTVDLRHDAGQISELRVRVSDASPTLQPRAGEPVLRGGMITGPFAEPHVHLDAALLAHRAPNRSGTLREGIENWARLRGQLTAADVTERATKTARMYAALGTLRIRTHVDTGNLTAVQALLDLRGPLALEGIELQVVAFPQQGILRTPERLASWRRAVEMGCDAVGAIPHYERTTEEGWQSVRMAFELAETFDVQVDLHCDETDDPTSRNLEVVCAETIDRGWGDRVVAGHCTAMHSYPDPYADKIVRLVAESGLLVVANPLDNIVLQGRYDGYPKRRGITRVDELWAVGARVGIGHDSVMDPWYRLGTAHMIDPAYMLVHAAHLSGEDQMRRVFSTLHAENHIPWGGAPKIVEGSRTAVLWWAEDDPVEVLRLRSRPTVIR